MLPPHPTSLVHLYSPPQLQSGMASLSSEYDHKYQSFDVETYAKPPSRLTFKSKPAAPLPPVELTYESTYDTMTANTKALSRKINVVARHAAHTAAVRTNKRRMSVAVAEAANVARNKAEEKASQEPAHNMHPELKRRFSQIAMEAAEKSEAMTIKAEASNKKDTVVFGSDANYTSKSWVSTYDSGYQQPAYLTKMAKAAEAAALAAIQFKRETGLCSEYLAKFEEFDNSDMAGAASVPTDMNMVGECLDFTQAEAGNQQPSTHTFVPRRVAWSSEYAATFNEEDIDESQGTTTTERASAPVNSNGNQVMECMDWVGAEPSIAVETNDPPPCPTGSSMYSKDFKHHKYTPQAAFLPPAITEISGCMDWNKINKVAAAAAASAPATSSSTTGAKDDWVMVETPTARSNRAVIPGWGSVKSSEQMMTTYDWDFDGAWKKFRPKTIKTKNKNKSKTGSGKAAAQKASNARRQAKIRAMATQKGVAKQSASELFVAEKMLPFFATGSEYQKKFSVPAAVRRAAVSKVVEKQKAIASTIKKITRPATENNTILRGRRLGLDSMINLTSYQSHFGNNRQPSLKARIGALAAADRN